MKIQSSFAMGVVALLCLVVPAAVWADDVSEETAVVIPAPAATSKPVPGKHLEGPPEYGLYYNQREPSFYTGFAPRSQQPERVHLQIGRGNQLRITLVLSDEAIDGYASDLSLRAATYADLIASKRVRLTQNTTYEDMQATLEAVDLAAFVNAQEKLSPTELRERNLELMERLNPGRVFRIDMPVDELVRRWAVQVEPADRESLSRDRKLDLVNQMLPTRLWLAELGPQDTRALTELVRAVPEDPGDSAALEALTNPFLELLARVSKRIYGEAQDGRLRFVEFTAVHPIGTFNDYTDFRGKRIPLYPTPGRRALTTHQRSQTVDHIPTKWAYSYFPWIPYMHVGANLHNSFHTLWWAMPTAEVDFLPAEWQGVSEGSRNGGAYGHIFLLSRGPMSSGCTHLNGGHISELRQAMPSDTQKLYEIDVFLNRSYDYDVFDIDGDFVPEVMGVEYFIAYSLSNKKPKRLRVRNERHAYYAWLYAGTPFHYDDDDRLWFDEVTAARFVERTAKGGRTYENIELYEAAYEPELIQFYRVQGIEFARELRKVASDHPFEGALPKAAAPQ